MIDQSIVYRYWRNDVLKETPQRRQPYLFTLRIWQEMIDENQTEWRGQLIDTYQGDKRAFRDLTSLIPLLLAMIRQIQSNDRSPDPPGIRSANQADSEPPPYLQDSP